MKSNVPNTFNWEFYIKYNKDLQDYGIATKEQAWEHWIENGSNENRNYTIPYDFDWKFYLYYNRDLINNGIDNKEKAWDHWYFYGQTENRLSSIPESFDWIFYVNFYSDLEHINSKSKAFKHWFFYGQKENRIYCIPDDFDWEFYISFNEDLQNFSSKLLAWNHYYFYGQYENRIYCIPNDFDWEFYVQFYFSELSYINSKVDACKHWFQYGRIENRVHCIPIDFDWEFYVKLYDSDLLHIHSRFEAFNHWYYHGQYEGRIYCIPNDFNWQFYVVIYEKELNFITNEMDAFKHWYYHGQHEGRIYNVQKEFDWQFYIKYNIDLSENLKNEMDALNHWYYHGQYEYRLCNVPKKFNWEYYVNYYSDLNFINTKEEAWDHWYNNGQYEGRSYFINDECIEIMNKMDNLTNINISYEYFNWEYYVTFNTDLNHIKDKQSAWDHWINKGKEEGRVFSDVPIDFDYISYIYNNFDLFTYGINTKDKAIKHWINEGKKEGRIYKQEIMKNLIAAYLQNNFTKNDNLFNISVNLSCNDEFNKELNYEQFTSYAKKEMQNVIEYDNYNKNNTFLHVDNITNSLYSKPISIINDLNSFHSFILIVDFPKLGGGTSVFLDTIISKYKYHQTFLIARNFNGIVKFNINEEYELNITFNQEESIQFLKDIKDKIIKIFVNHILNHSYSFLNSLFKLNKKITSITHDYSLIMNNAQLFYHNITNNNSIDKNILDINAFDTIVTQNYANLHIFKTYQHPSKEIVISELPDFKNTLDRVESNNTKIVIGVIGIISSLKGKLIVEFLINHFENTEIEIVIFGVINVLYDKLSSYNNIHEFNELLNKYKPNLWLDVSLWPETYSYTLTLEMITKLPIVYLKKPFESVIQNRLSKYEKSYGFSTVNEFIHIIHNVKQNYFYTIEPIIYFNSFWDNYFITNTEKKFFNKNLFENKYDIQPYCIYFPQFHPIAENNISFYYGYTDIENLQLLANSNPLQELEQPFLNELDLKYMTDYNLNNMKIIQKQIDIINDYDIAGFAIYYYWFSLNTITNKNMIMETVINQFFDDSINMKNRKVFFIWANENWSSNPAFGSTNEKIENDYSEESIRNNIKTLIEYFKQERYLKLENRPVFFIYHTWFLTQFELDLFRSILDYECKLVGFDGVHLIVNSMNGEYDNYRNFYINFNYKNSTARSYNELVKQHYIDYKEYASNPNNSKSVIQTIVFDFNNKARLAKPDKQNLSTICINNTEADKVIFMDKIIETYKKDKTSDVENILLINAWNEWGEKMTVEPSNEYHYYYLNLLKTKLNSLKIDKFNDYPNLFYKYLHNYSDITKSIDIFYSTRIFMNKKTILHIHCMDLNNFETYFSNYLDHSLLLTNIIVTYCIENKYILENYLYSIQFLQVKNKGYDVGGKICCIKHLHELNYDYDCIIFIHSKSNNLKREQYISPLLKDYNQLSYVISQFNKNLNLLGVFPNLLITEQSDYHPTFFGTRDYRNEILDFLGCKNKECIFVEGNVMALRKNVIDFIFFNNCENFYNLFNDINSFDINWFKLYYFLNVPDMTNEKAIFLKINYPEKYFYINDLQPLQNNDRVMRDCMVEHVFERITINVIKELGGEFLLLD